MKRKLPPLNAIKAFESAARLKSFTKAATELLVTQGAVSKQIKTLEEFLGVQVFQRNNNKLILTKAGQNYFDEITKLLGNLEDITKKLYAKKSIEKLVINSTPSFAYFFLTPNVDEFEKNNIEVDIKVGDGPVDFEKGSYEVAIRSFLKKPKTGDVYNKIYDEILIPVCSPKLLKDKKIKNISDLYNFKLLEHSSRKDAWKKFFKSKKLKFEQKNKVGLEHFFMLIHAAKDGKGIALVPELFARKLINNGELVIPLKAKPFKSGYSYYLIYSKNLERSSNIKFLSKFILNKKP